MAYKLIVKTLAEKDISEAVAWYNARDTHLTPKFIEKIDQALRILQKSPKNFQKRYNEIRVIFTEIFPFGIYFTIENKTVFIHAILYTKRNPKAGIERI